MRSALFAFFSSVIRVPVMGSAPFALLPRVIRAPVLGRAYSAAPTLFLSGLYEILRKLEGEVPKFFSGRGELFVLVGRFVQK
jgi:drug/metabolite transporter superfamily protein YnfA